MPTPFRALSLFAGMLLVLFLALPLLALVGQAPRLSWAVLLDPALREALWLSLRTTLAALVLVVLTGTPLAWSMARGRSRFLAALQPLLDLPLVLPPTVAGLGLLLAFGRAGLLGGMLDAFGLQLPFTTAAVVCAQVFVSAPLFLTAARSAFEGVEPTLEETAATLGSGEGERFLRVTLPLAAPGILAGAVLATARALGEFGATLMFAGNLPGVTRTLPLAVYGALQVDPDRAIALSLILLLLAALLLAVLRFVARRRPEARDAHR